MPHDTRFQPGQSGKKPGTRNRATMLIEQMMGDEAAQLGRVAIEEALARKPYAVRACLDRVAPRPRRQAVVLDLPKADTPAGVVACGARLIEAVAEGEIVADDARLVGDLLDGQRRAIETVELERRIALLEGRLGLGDGAEAAA
jgi:hypothetical protein